MNKKTTIDIADEQLEHRDPPSVVSLDRDQDKSFAKFLQRHDFNDKLLGQQFGEEENTPGLTSPGEDEELNKGKDQCSVHFKFEAVAGKETQVKLGTSVTPAVKAGLTSLANSLCLSESELVRHALFAVDEDHTILDSIGVRQREKAYSKVSNTKGGARGGGRPPTQKRTP